VTQDQLQRIQSICRDWLSNPATTRDSRLTIPLGAVVPHAIMIDINTILTFDNVLISSAVDAETGVCYTKLIGKAGEPGIFIDPPLEMIATERAHTPENSSMLVAASIASKREVVKPHHDPAITFDPDREKFLLCANEIVLGFSALEKTHSENHRSGRFFPSDDYFEYAEIFEARPQVENDYLEASLREAYGLMDEKADEYRKEFNELSARIDALNLYVADQNRNPIAIAEVRLEDLSRYYGDQRERWLHVDFAD
jgi:hypothetical protein